MKSEEYARLHAFEDWYWWFVARRQAALQFAHDFGPPPGPIRVLDAGCGTGSLMDRLRERSDVEVTGIDVAPEALAFSRKRGQDRLIQGDLTALPFATASFDLVTALEVVEHVESDETALAELCRVLKPGGTLLLSVPAYRFLWSSHDVALHHKRRYTAHRIQASLTRAGLDSAKVTYLLSFLFVPVALVRLFDKLVRRSSQARAHLSPIPPLLNRFLIALQNIELALARHVNLPFGISLFCVARKRKIAGGT
jgi:ubiquinone/menaquinone biosynthesis C-methylase UbiE